MLPHLPGSNGPATPKVPVRVPPPLGLRLPLTIYEAGWSGSDFAIKAAGETHAQRLGLRYEKKVLAQLGTIFAGSFHPSPPLYYKDQNGLGLAIPDGIILGLRSVLCIEVKSQHMPEAWWQLRKKYEPVLRKIYPEVRILLLEICNQLDSAQPFPEVYDYVDSLVLWEEHARDGALGVYQWKL